MQVDKQKPGKYSTFFNNERALSDVTLLLVTTGARDPGMPMAAIRQQSIVMPMAAIRGAALICK